MMNISGTPKYERQGEKREAGKESRRGREKVGVAAQKRQRQRGTASGTDRFIRSRATFDVDVAHYNLRADDALASGQLDTSPAKELYKQTLNERLFGGRAACGVLHDSSVASPVIREQRRLMSSLRVLDQTALWASRSTTERARRVIPRNPLRILDAPDMLEDYYLNLLDWSSKNVLAVALNRAVYLWHAATGEIHKLYELRRPESNITSLKWTESGDHLAIGTSTHDVQIWDAATRQRVRTFRDHQGRVSVLAWHGNMLASGSRDACVHIHDVRSEDPLIQTLTKHSQEVCGLAWSQDGILASGGNDNLVCLWEPARSPTPRHTLAHHTAAVKGLAWCPWQSNLLASGGGTADRTIRFWDASNGASINSIDTKSQVCSILWSPHYRELVSSHGFSQNQLCVWSYPNMVKLCELTGHSARVLHMAMSPDGETVCSASGDETLRFWRIFERRRPAQDERQSLTHYSQHLHELPSVRLR